MITTSFARKLRGGTDLPASPAFKDVFVKSGAGAGLYVCLIAGSWTGPFDDSTVGDGDVQGPALSTDNTITRFDSTSGKVIQNSLVTIDDSGSVNIPTGQTYKINNAALAKGDVGLGNIDNTSDAAKPISSATQIALDAKAPLSPSVNAQTGTTYTLVALDNGKIVTLDNGAAITVTVPAGLGAGFNCVCIQKGAGQVTFVADTATLTNRQSQLKIAGQWGTVSILAPVANALVLSGDTAA
jgi:hypothetical protein